LPWVGKNYSAGFHGIRTLVLGESHYDKHGKGYTKYHTQQLVEGQVTGQGKYSGKWWFWTKVVRTIGGPKADKAEFWNSVSYHVYIQQFVGKAPRERPTEEMWAAAKASFFEVIEELRPECLLVLGVGLWNHLPKDCAVKRSTDAVTYRVRKTATVAGHIPHPSSFGFSCSHWTRTVQRYLLLAKRNQS
jgi:hypothetical protein